MDLIRPILSILTVFGLLGVALWWLGRKNLLQFSGFPVPRNRPSNLETIDRMRLTPHHSLHVVRAGDQVIILALHGAGCTVVDSIPLAEWKDS